MCGGERERETSLITLQVITATLVVLSYSQIIPIARLDFESSLVQLCLEFISRTTFTGIHYHWRPFCGVCLCVCVNSMMSLTKIKMAKAERCGLDTTSKHLATPTTR